MNHDCAYLAHLRTALRRIARYTSGGEAAFVADEMVQDAVLRNLQTLAEATQRLSDAAKAAHPEIPWRSIAGFRNVLVHNHLGLDLGHVWPVVETDLPPLRVALEALWEAQQCGERP